MQQKHPAFDDPQVAQAFAKFAPDVRDGLMALRGLIFECAAADPGIGRVHETLKWGQPSYLTPDTKSGSTLRLGVPKSGGFALYVHCQTTLLTDFRHLFPDAYTYEGNRAVTFTTGQDIMPDTIAALISNALTYHVKSKRVARTS
ncbi:protein of unknown function (DU1801) [Monaibacterium marinum]|uniref:YdhG-like domain-containing protein n=1 Tax=Pontivivens marinum TaxID=1690039 RepID=A0A2C9CVJ4_9RHOB|nr:DUF1801 domain-containing protein [Monaibacterium marinum]SOH95145.1 protein of unknown function (DU1801) [Monaibacterium marinum]